MDKYLLNFDPNLKIPPLAGQQTPQLLYRIFQIFVEIFGKNMNCWLDKS